MEGCESGGVLDDSLSRVSRFRFELLVSRVGSGDEDVGEEVIGVDDISGRFKASKTTGLELASVLLVVVYPPRLLKQHGHFAQCCIEPY